MKICFLIPGCLSWPGLSASGRTILFLTTVALLQSATIPGRAAGRETDTLDGGTLTTPRSGHTATLLPDGRVIVVSGFATTIETPATELYDPATNSWTATGNLNQARNFHATCLLPDGRVLTAGGQKFGANDLKSAEIWDPATGQWSYTGDLITPQLFTDMVTLPNGKALIAGGGSSPSAELYDPTSGTWSATGELNHVRGLSHLTLLNDGTVLLAGGQVPEAEIYHPDTGQWTVTGAMAIPRSRFVQVLLADGRVLVAGGETSKGRRIKSAIASTEIFDPATGLWSRAANMRTARRQFTGNLLADGTVLAAGGTDENNALAGAIEVFDPSTNRWRTTRTGLSIPRASHTGTILLNGDLIIAGGANFSGPVAMAELILSR